MIEAQQQTLRLKSGHDMPVLGLGTWELKGDTCREMVLKAIALGYSHIDTAEMYGNEGEIGEAIAGVKRESLFVTSKFPQKYLAKDDLLDSCRRSLDKLGTDYLDLYLLHWPNDEVDLGGTVEAIAQLHDEGVIRSFGVSNFDSGRIREVMSLSDVAVSNLQIEYHPFTKRNDLPSFCQQEGIAITAYSPLARGKVFENETLSDIAKSHGKSAAQVSLRWLVQKGNIVIPKASSEEHLRNNMDIFDWTLSEEDVDKIDHLEERERLIDTKYT